MIEPANVQFAKKKFDARDMLICAMSASGLNAEQISEFVHCTVNTVRWVLNDPRGQILRAQYSSDIAQRVVTSVAQLVEATAEEAILTIREIMRDTTAPKNVRLSAAIELKNTAGFKPVERQLRASIDIPASPEDAMDIRDTLKQLIGNISEYDDVDNSSLALGVNLNLGSGGDLNIPDEAPVKSGPPKARELGLDATAQMWDR